MLPGKNYKPEDYLEILWRRRLIIGVPLVLFTIATAIYARSLPNLYRSEATILVVPQRVPESYIHSTVTARIEERLTSMSQQITSRARLERLIQDFDLYREERSVKPMEDVVEQMRKDISIDIDRARRAQGGAFRIGFVARSATSAMQVSEKLASMFIEENLRDRAVLAEQTSQFLDTQLEQARARLEEQEEALEAYRLQHGPEMPAQLQSNIQVLQNTQMQLQALRDGIARDHDRRLVLERLLTDASTPIVSPAPPAEPQAPAASAAQQLEAARVALQALELKYTAEHPDLQRARRFVGELEEKARLEAALGMPTDPVIVASGAELNRRRRVSQLKADLAALDLQVNRKEQEETRLVGQVALYQQRIEAAPTRESELVQLNRDYNTMNEVYQKLLAKKQDSEVAANLERRQIGEQFRVIDPARLPATAFSPNRPRLHFLGALAGLAFGLVLAGLIEYRDTAVRSEEDVVSAIALPVLALVPSMISERDRVRQRRQRVVAVCATTALVLVCAAVFVWRTGLLPGQVG
jgi:polysaccharide chain length determinant protein (PEP-CTERM system associated)